MNLLDQRIKTFASQGLSPYEIEEKLGIKHYTIRIEHHEALMNGYVTAPASGRVHTLSAEEKAERKRERAKERWEEKKEEAKKQGEVPKRVKMTHEERLAAIQIVDEQRNRDGSRGVKEISPTARAVLNQRTYRRPGYDNIQETQTAD